MNLNGHTGPEPTHAPADTAIRTRHPVPYAPPAAPAGHNGVALRHVDGRRASTPDHELEELTRRQLELLGEDPDREGLLKTPERVARSLAWLTHGYRLTPRSVVGDAIFEEQSTGMVLVRDIELYSLCEHHLLPFFGHVHVAYIPNGRVIGLSKLPRLVDVFARRLQVQERLTEEIASAVDEVLEPRGVRVVVEAVHMCMTMRGVQKQDSATVTSATRGVFATDPAVEMEFQRLMHASRGGWR
ncbi:MAG TPA: GTP cyclohydrolase I FolE [Rhodothermales bacterium]